MTPFDRWLTDDEPFISLEYDPDCPDCGHAFSDHPTVHITNEDGEDYETQRCPE